MFFYIDDNNEKVFYIKINDKCYETDRNGYIKVTIIPALIIKHKLFKLTPEEIALTFKNEPDAFITKIKNRPDFCDSEIFDFDDPLKEPSKNLESLLTQKWNFVKEQNELYTLPEFFAITFESENKNIKFMAIECKYKSSPDDAQFLVVIRPYDFIIVSVIGSHPMVETSYMTYCNSDGSGPSLFDDDIKRNPNALIEKLIKYYTAFVVEDKYH